MIDERIIKLALDFLLKFPDEGMNILNSDLCMPNINQTLDTRLAPDTNK